MRTIKLVVQYDGSDYVGWQRQGKGVSVQGLIEQALAAIDGAPVTLHGAGRTDAGVHARGQVASFVADHDVDLERLQQSINGMLAPEVVAEDVRRAPEGFDARFSATARVYRYRMDTGLWPDPFEARFVWHRPGELSVRSMRAAAGPLLGDHDFASFCRRPQSGGTVRRLERFSIARAGDRIEISARANAFVHQMVRTLVGTLVSVGDGRIEPVAVQEILLARDRGRAAQMAPAHGLTLERVVYGRHA